MRLSLFVAATFAILTAGAARSVACQSPACLCASKMGCGTSVCSCSIPTLGQAIEQSFQRRCGHAPDPASVNYYVNAVQQSRITLAEAQQSIEMSCLSARSEMTSCVSAKGLPESCQ